MYERYNKEMGETNSPYPMVKLSRAPIAVLTIFKCEVGRDRGCEAGIMGRVST